MNDIIIEHLPPPNDAERLRKMLTELDKVIIPQLSVRVDINEYALKLASLADAFYIVKNNQDIGHCAIYLNDAECGFISSIAVKKEFHRNGMGKQLLKKVKETAYEKGIFKIRLEVFRNNFAAVDFYQKTGFYIVKQKGDWIIMQCDYIQIIDMDE